MANYIDPFKFLPTSTINLLKEQGYWGVDDVEWEELITDMEGRAIGVIMSLLNFDLLGDQPFVIQELVTNHVLMQLYSPLIQVRGMADQAYEVREQFNLLIETIGNTQREEGHSTEEGTRKTAGLIVFN